MEMTEQYWTVPEAAAFLGVSKSAIYEAVREERIASEMVFGRRVVKREAVLAYQQKTAGVGPKGGRPRQKKRGRPRLHPLPSADEPKRPVGRPRKTLSIAQET